MPSGSHMSSGGSHFHGGGASHRSVHTSRVSSRNTFHSRPIFIWIGRGRRVRMPERFMWMIVLMPFLFMSMIFLFFLGGSMYSTNNSEIKKIEVDRAYYLSMIHEAETNPDLIVQGVVTGKFYNDDCEKWYFEYEIPYTLEDYDGYEFKLEGQTFCVYSTEEIAEIHVNDQIQIVVDALPITKNTDSIPLDYKDMPLERNGEYVSARNDLNISIGLLVGGGAVAGIAILLVAIIFVKAKKEYNKSTQTTTQQAPQSPAIGTTSNAERKEQNGRQTKIVQKDVNLDDPFAQNYFKCPNCGADITADQKTCSICGAKLKRNKNTNNS